MTPYEFVEYVFSHHASQAFDLCLAVLAFLLIEVVRTLLAQRGRQDALEDRQEARAGGQLSELIGLVKSLTDPMTSRLDQLLTELVGATRRNEAVTTAIPKEVLVLILPELKQLEATLQATIRQAEAHIITRIAGTPAREEPSVESPHSIPPPDL